MIVLKFSRFALLAFGLALSVSSVCRAQVESSSPLADRKSLPCTPAKIQQCRTVLPIERGAGFGVILVNVRVNGKPAVLILDTGSSTTILSPEASGLDPINLRHAAPPKKGTGFVEDARWGEATLVTGARVWKDHRILVADMKSISGAMCQKIDGILGQDILYEFNYIEIDFEHKRLVLGSNE
jgi:Aspartyl protease